MNYKKIKADSSAITRDLNDFDKETDNIYESLVILSRRANQIAADLREELGEKIQDVATTTTGGDASEEFFENKEQIELASQYEQLPKPSLYAIEEFLNGQIYYRLPEDNKREAL